MAMMPALEDWLARSKTFDWRGGGVRYWTEGEITSGRPTLLLLHGFPSASFDWRYMWDDLARDFTLIAADMIGYGLSDKPPQYTYSLSDQADMVWALLDQVGAGDVHILAHDVGDTVAQELLARQIDSRGGRRVLSCVLTNGGIFVEEIRRVRTQSLLLGRFGPIFARLMGRRQLAKGMGAIFGTAHPITSEEVQAFWELVTYNNGKRVLSKLIQYLHERAKFRDRWVGALTHAPCPLRFVVGPEDSISGAHMAERYCELVRSPDVVLLPGVGHYPQIEDAAGVLKAFREFHEMLKKQNL